MLDWLKSISEKLKKWKNDTFVKQKQKEVKEKFKKTNVGKFIDKSKKSIKKNNTFQILKRVLTRKKDKTSYDSNYKPLPGDNKPHNEALRAPSNPQTQDVDSKELIRRITLITSIYENIKVKAYEINANLLRVKIDFGTETVKELTPEKLSRMTRQELEVANKVIEKEISLMGISQDVLNNIVNKEINNPGSGFDEVKDVTFNYAYEVYISSWEKAFMNSDDEELPIDPDDRRKMWEDIKNARSFEWWSDKEYTKKLYNEDGW